MKSRKQMIEEIHKTKGLSGSIDDNFRKGTKLNRFLHLANFDPATGKSNIIELKNLSDLNTKNGGDWCREKGYSLSALLFWNKVRAPSKGKRNKRKILFIGTTGYNVHFSASKTFARLKEKVPCVFTGIPTNFQDHKYGNYESFDEGDMRADEKQPTLEAINTPKARCCENCKATRKRPPAPSDFEIPYTEGDENYNGDCHGCHVFSPEEFRRQYYQIMMKKKDEEIHNLKTRLNNIQNQKEEQ